MQRLRMKINHHSQFNLNKAPLSILEIISTCVTKRLIYSDYSFIPKVQLVQASANVNITKGYKRDNFDESRYIPVFLLFITINWKRG